MAFSNRGVYVLRNITKPKFSVIIPVYNTEKYIDEAVKSVLAQKEPSYEILLVDDGSTDNSGANCDKWALMDQRIKVFHQRNMGQIAAREQGLNNATGEYVVFLDSDDLLDYDTLKCLDEEFKNNNADCIVYGYRKLEDGVIGSECVDKEKTVINDVNIIYKKIFSDLRYNSMCRKAFRRKLINYDDYHDFYHLRHGEDLVQSIMLLYRCKTVVFLNRVFYTYRMVSTSISHNRNIYNCTECFGAREVVYNLLLHYDRISSETMTCYTQHCLKQFAGVIVSLLNEKKAQKEKIEKLTEMRSLPWYKTLQSATSDYSTLTCKERIIMWLFSNEHMNALSRLIMCWRIIRHD